MFHKLADAVVLPQPGNLAGDDTHMHFLTIRCCKCVIWPARKSGNMTKTGENGNSHPSWWASGSFGPNLFRCKKCCTHRCPMQNFPRPAFCWNLLHCPLVPKLKSCLQLQWQLHGLEMMPAHTPSPDVTTSHCLWVCGFTPTQHDRVHT